MKEFRITELSAVDSPAQKGALAVIMKRDEGVNYEKIQRDSHALRGFDTLEDAMEYLRTDHGLTKLGALERVAREHPQLVRKYNLDGERTAKAAAEEIAKLSATPQAVVDFEKCVAEIMANDNLPMLAALEKARVDYPGAFRAYQEA